MKIIVLIFVVGIFQFSNGNPTWDIKIVGGEDAVLGQFPIKFCGHTMAMFFAVEVFTMSLP